MPSIDKHLHFDNRETLSHIQNDIQSELELQDIYLKECLKQLEKVSNRVKLLEKERDININHVNTFINLSWYKRILLILSKVKLKKFFYE